MIATVAVTVLALLSSVVLALAGWGAPAAVAHLAFAAGIVPLIFAAMSHFVPVLTRSGSPARTIRLIPPAAQVMGLLAAAAMQGLLPRAALHAAAGADFLLAAALLGWIVGRARRCLGKPHPGWRWYGAALLCLLLALAAVPALLAYPAAYGTLRAMHLHLNTLGLVGLAAFGTLPVLLPTALGRPDPEAGSWLLKRLWSFIAGLALVVVGILVWPLSVLGGLLLGGLATGLLRQWGRRFSWTLLAADGPAASLCAAVGGFLLLTISGLLHGAGLVAARPAIAAWAAAFLLPLVTGALSQLLPVWRLPGPATPARARMRARLAATGRWRGLLFLTGGACLMLDLPGIGGFLTGGGMALFAIGFIQALRVKASAS